MITAFVLNAMRPGLILFSLIVLFLATGIISPQDALAGFSNKGVIIIGLLFLVNEGIRHSGLLARFARIYLPRKNKEMPFLLARVMVPVTFLSGFLNNLPLVVNFAPVLLKWGEARNIPSQKLLIPLSYAAILGGMCTLIGTSSNLVVYGLLIENNMQGLTLFELSQVGGVVAVFGFIYMAVFGNLLLPGDRIKLKKGKEKSKDYYYNLIIPEGSTMIGKPAKSGKIEEFNDFEIINIERNGKVITAQNNNLQISQGDMVLVSGKSDRLDLLMNNKNIKIKGINKLQTVPRDQLKQYEVVLSPRFMGLGQTIGEFDFFGHFQAVVTAIHRNGEIITSNLNNLKLKVGDNLVLLATEKFELNWKNSKYFYLMTFEQDYTQEGTFWKKWKALIILLMMIAGILINEIVSYGFGLRLDFLLLVALAALGMIWFNILPHHRYTRFINWDVVVTIASAIAISKALQNTGIAENMAKSSIGFVERLGPVGVMAIIYLLTAFVTEIITNNAAVALIFPIAVSAASQLNVDPKPFIVAIAISGAASFTTARGYQTNLVIKSLGNYRNTDYLKIGIPMQLIAFFTSIWLIPKFWQF